MTYSSHNSAFIYGPSKSWITMFADVFHMALVMFLDSKYTHSRFVLRRPLWTEPVFSNK